MTDVRTSPSGPIVSIELEGPVVYASRATAILELPVVAFGAPTGFTITGIDVPAGGQLVINASAFISDTASSGAELSVELVAGGQVLDTIEGFNQAIDGRLMVTAQSVITFVAEQIGISAVAGYKSSAGGQNLTQGGITITVIPP